MAINNDEVLTKEAIPEHEEAKARPTLRIKFGKKMIPLIGGILLVQLVAGYFLVAKFFLPAEGTPPVEQMVIEHKDESSPGKSIERGTGDIHILEDIIVNPAGTLGNRYLVTSIAFEVDPENKGLAKEIKDREPVIRDRIITLLSSKGIPELIDVSRRDSLRQEILQAVNQELQEGEVFWAYFTEYVLQ